MRIASPRCCFNKMKQSLIKIATHVVCPYMELVRVDRDAPSDPLSSSEKHKLQLKSPPRPPSPPSTPLPSPLSMTQLNTQLSRGNIIYVYIISLYIYISYTYSTYISCTHTYIYIHTYTYANKEYQKTSRETNVFARDRMLKWSYKTRPFRVFIKD